MIIRPHSIGNPWFRAALSLIFFMTLIFIFFWAAFEGGKLTSPLGINFLIIIFLISILLLVQGKLEIFPMALKNYTLIIGFFVFIPVYLLILTPICIAISISSISFNSIILIFTIYFFWCFFWCFLKIVKIRSVINNYDYFEKETELLPCGRLIIYGEFATDIDDLSSALKNDNKCNYKKIFFAILPVTVIAYPMQKILFQNGGAIAVFTCCALFCLPLSIYVLGEIASGFYIWIFASSKFEKLHGKIILLT